MVSNYKIVPYGRLRGLRAERGMKQSDVANIIGISSIAYTLKENGKSDFKASEMASIMKLFNASADEIFFNH